MQGARAASVRPAGVALSAPSFLLLWVRGLELRSFTLANAFTHRAVLLAQERLTSTVSRLPHGWVTVYTVN